MTSRRDEGAPIVGRAYELCAALYEHVDRFPRAQRTLLGRVVLDDGLRMLTALARANRLADKRPALIEASGRLDALRIGLRLAKRLGFLSNRGYESLTESADEVGRMLGGWLRYERGRPAEAEPDTGVGRKQDGPPGKQPSRAPSRRGAVRYTMRSPLVERYLAAKLAHPGAIVVVRNGAFCQAFFEDARLLGRAGDRGPRPGRRGRAREDLHVRLSGREARGLRAGPQAARPRAARGVGGVGSPRPDSWRQLQQRHECGAVRGQRQQPAVELEQQHRVPRRPLIVWAGQMPRWLARAAFTEAAPMPSGRHARRPGPVAHSGRRAPNTDQPRPVE